MDPANAIEVRNIFKSYKVKVRKGNNSILRKKTTMIKNDVINGISLDIRKGDVLGVLGRNGSGKSTFLSLLARIMEPDSGTINRSGKIASILELGMGFHNDMSGRENIYLKGELYGFSKKEIDEKIESIIDYSGIRKYIDNPVRTYSSGMTGRLAFAIMVNVESEIMLVDEVLSVGDAAFANKAKEHFHKLAASGKTVVLVSHQLSAIESMCNRAIWIENGKIVEEGDAKYVCSKYQNMLNESPDIVAELAHAGLAESQYKLAIMYRDGINFEKDDEKYEEWIKKAAIQGHTRAQVEYADLLLERGETKDALLFYQYAANNWDYEARMKLSYVNSTDNGDLEELLNMYQQLASSDDHVNKYRYADLILKTSWRKEDLSKAFTLMKESADSGYPEAMYRVGVMYRDGIGVIKDLGMMDHYLTSAAEKGSMDSITTLIQLYSEGKIVPKDDKQYFKWVYKASELGHTEFMFILASLYKEGRGVDKNDIEAAKWYDNYVQSRFYMHRRIIAEYVKSGFVDTKQTVEDIYSEIINTKSDYWALINSINYNVVNKNDISGDFRILLLLANNGNIEAIKQLGRMYIDGIGVDRDIPAAIDWLEKGSALGDVWCREQLERMKDDTV